MINAVFYKRGSVVTGFEIKGHSGYGTAGEDIICASVSSAVYMAINTITDVIGDNADISVSDGFMSLRADGASAETQALLRGLEFHVENLAQEYSEYISFKQTLVKE